MKKIINFIYKNDFDIGLVSLITLLIFLIIDVIFSIVTKNQIGTMIMTTSLFIMIVAWTIAFYKETIQNIPINSKIISFITKGLELDQIYFIESIFVLIILICITIALPEALPFLIILILGIVSLIIFQIRIFRKK